MANSKIIGTRGSDLALFQTRLIASLLKEKGIEAAEQIIKTRGDLDYRPFTELTGDGFFTKELEHALLGQKIDFAVHSAKDLPSMIHGGIPWRAVNDRANTTDVILAKKGVLGSAQGGLQLRPGLRVGTSSPRRVAQLEARYKGVIAVHLRGNVPTRARKVLTDEFDAVVLAKAGLDRLELLRKLESEGIEWRQLDWVTAPCQGILGVQTRSDLLADLELIQNKDLHEIALAEKSVLAWLGGGCHLPLGCRITHTANGYRMALFLKDDSNFFEFTIDDKKLGDLLRNAFQRLSHSPLTGPTIWLTSPLQHHMKPARMLTNAGIRSGSWPLVEIAPSWNPGDFEDLKKTWNEIGPVAIASSFGANIFLKEFVALYLSKEEFKKHSVFCVGEATRKPFDEAQLRVEELPDEATAENLAARIASSHHRGPVLIAGTTQSRLKAALEEKNLRYQTLELYTTRPSLSPLTTDFPHFTPNDVVAFTSPSAVEVFALHVLAVPGMKKLRTAALGPSTANALRKIGFEPIVASQTGHWSSLVDQIKKEVRS